MVAQRSDARRRGVAKPQRTQPLPHVTPSQQPSPQHHHHLQHYQPSAPTALATPQTTAAPPPPPTSSTALFKTATEAPTSTATHLQLLFSSNTPLSSRSTPFPGSSGGHALGRLELEHLASTRLTTDRIRPFRPPISPSRPQLLQPSRPAPLDPLPEPPPVPDPQPARKPRQTQASDKPDKSTTSRRSRARPPTPPLFSQTAPTPEQPPQPSSPTLLGPVLLPSPPPPAQPSDSMADFLRASTMSSSFPFSSSYKDTPSSTTSSSTVTSTSQLHQSPNTPPTKTGKDAGVKLPKFKTHQEKVEFLREKIARMQKEEEEIMQQMIDTQREKEVLETVYNRLAEQEKRRDSSMSYRLFVCCCEWRFRSSGTKACHYLLPAFMSEFASLFPISQMPYMRGMTSDFAEESRHIGFRALMGRKLEYDGFQSSEILAVLSLNYPKLPRLRIIMSMSSLANDMLDMGWFITVALLSSSLPSAGLGCKRRLDP
ncbi:hypothetical protein BJ508DRAFT_307674 [Ascobolus immersus RN42]|uniref:Uncharacterized protein n=1 Tax=Ascobolus immersus RN42 TaxID=1160509 RepID=A0A3N4I3Z8_ASCIM|nr:hypothetical protein BJ508DRAFT_307674 [Ascobolus immersus RN42]